MAELVVDGRAIIPIRAIPFHTGNFIGAREVACLLADPESFGGMIDTGLTGHYLDRASGCHPMFAYEFNEMQRELSAAPTDAKGVEWIKLLMPMVLVFRKQLEYVLYGLWSHHASRGAALDRGEFEFNPAPHITAEEELLVYAGFEHLLTNGKVEVGEFLTPDDRCNEAHRLLNKLVRLAAENNIPFDLSNPPGRRADMVALLSRNSSAFRHVQPDTLEGYIYEYGCRFKPGRPSNISRLNRALYELM